MKKAAGQKPVEGAVAFRKPSSLWGEGYSWVLTILVVEIVMEM